MHADTYRSAAGSGGGAGRSGSRPGRVVDLHTHLMPGVDDGALDWTEARWATEVLAGVGVERAVATPHVDASALADPARREDRLGELDRGWEDLVDAAGPGVEVHRGAEVRLDAPEPDLSDPRLQLGGSGAVLVEFARLTLPPHGARQLRGLAEAGWLPVLAHPERYRGIAERPGAADSWRDAGAVLQVNCGSLVGQYGPAAREAAWRLLEDGQADLLATDWHARGPVRLEAAVEALREREGAEQVRPLLEVNPRRILEGREPTPVRPVPRPEPGWIDRLLGAPARPRP